MRPRAVLLDVGGVLLLPSHDAVRRALSSLAFVPDDARIDRAEYVAIRAADEAPSAGPEAVERYWAAFARALGVQDDSVDRAVVAFLQVFTPGSRTWTQPIEDSVHALRLLHAAGILVALVSNSHDILEDELQDLGICQVGAGPGVNVDAIVVSAVVGIEKPDRRIFELALRALEVEPSEAVHVGDSVRFDVEGATNAGVKAFHFDPALVCDRDGHQHMRSLHELLPPTARR